MGTRCAGNEVETAFSPSSTSRVALPHWGLSQLAEPSFQGLTEDQEGRSRDTGKGGVSDVPKDIS